MSHASKVRNLYALLLTALVLGMSLGQLAAGPGDPQSNKDCIGGPVVCPHFDICQYPSHCGIPDFHKCKEPSMTQYALCSIYYNRTCYSSLGGCKFQAWTNMCGEVAAGVYNPICYGECGSSF